MVMLGLQVGSNVLLTTICPLGPNGETRSCSAAELETTSPLKPVWPIAMANLMVVFHVLGSYQVRYVQTMNEHFKSLLNASCHLQLVHEYDLESRLLFKLLRTIAIFCMHGLQ